MSVNKKLLNLEHKVSVGTYSNWPSNEVVFGPSKRDDINIAFMKYEAYVKVQELQYQLDELLNNPQNFTKIPISDIKYIKGKVNYDISDIENRNLELARKTQKNPPEF